MKKLIGFAYRLFTLSFLVEFFGRVLFRKERIREACKVFGRTKRARSAAKTLCGSRPRWPRLVALDPCAGRGPSSEAAAEQRPSLLTARNTVALSRHLPNVLFIFPSLYSFIVFLLKFLLHFSFLFFSSRFDFTVIFLIFYL